MRSWHLEQIALGVDAQDAHFVNERAVENGVGFALMRIDVHPLAASNARPPLQVVPRGETALVTVTHDAPQEAHVGGLEDGQAVEGNRGSRMNEDAEGVLRSRAIEQLGIESVYTLDQQDVPRPQRAFGTALGKALSELEIVARRANLFARQEPRHVMAKQASIERFQDLEIAARRPDARPPDARNRPA